MYLKMLDGIYEPRSETGKRVILYMACLTGKEFRDHSCRAHVSYRVTPGFTAHVWPKNGYIKIVPAPRRSCICRLLEDTRDGVQAGKG